MSETKYTEIHNIKNGFQLNTVIESGRGDPITTLYIKGIVSAGSKTGGELENMSISDLTDLTYLLQSHLVEVEHARNFQGIKRPNKET